MDFNHATDDISTSAGAKPTLGGDTIFGQTELTKTIGNLLTPLCSIDLQNGISWKGKGTLEFENLTAVDRTYVDRYGVVQYAGTDVPRDGLIEMASTNLLLQSEDFSTTWITSGATISTDTETAPDGNVSADTLTITAASGNITQAVAVTGDTEYTFSIFAEMGTLAEADFTFAFYDNTNSAWIAQNATPSKLFNTSNGGARYSTQLTTPATCVSLKVYPMRNYNISSGTVHLWGAQLEALPFATSYQPTTTTAVTRQADLCLLDGVNCPDVNKDFTVIGNVTFNGDSESAISQFFSIQNAAGTNYKVRFYREHGTNKLGVTMSDITPALNTVLSASDTIAIGADYRIGCTFKRATNTLTLYLNGASLGSVSTVGAMESDRPSKFKLAGWGSDATTNAIGAVNISNVTIQQRCLTDAEMTLA